MKPVNIHLATRSEMEKLRKLCERMSYMYTCMFCYRCAHTHTSLHSGN